MILGAEIILSGPDFEEKEIFPDIVGPDFILKTRKAKKEAVDFKSIWVQIWEESEVTMAVNLDSIDLEEPIDFIIKGKNQEVSLGLSLKQASAIAKILQHYVDAFYAFKALEKEVKVDRL